ncbi:MAG TPA: hypothetical protein IAC70_04430 [Candidatus Faecicola pullistercoris]|nr:hypothetical protein [Candidatus Faecicola pullistercoris]
MSGSTTIPLSSSTASASTAAGADGIIIAEPLAGLFSADMAAEFSSKYVKEIVYYVKDDRFAVIYYNCGNTVIYN